MSMTAMTGSALNRIEIIVLLIALLTFIGIAAYQAKQLRLLRRERDRAKREVRDEAERCLAERERTRFEAARADAEAARVTKLTSAISHALDRNVEMQREIERFLQAVERRLSKLGLAEAPTPKSGNEPTSWSRFTRPASLAPPNPSHFTQVGYPRGSLKKTER